MNDEERIKFMQYMIEIRIEEIKQELKQKYNQKYITFKVYTSCGEIVADRYRFGDYASEYIYLYNNERYIAMIKIFAIEKIDSWYLLNVIFLIYFFEHNEVKDKNKHISLYVAFFFQWKK